jgi:sugar/nucleoside kinase (ribokinase family)
VIQLQKKILALTAGHVTLDCYSGSYTPGGSAFYSSLIFDHLNLKTALATSFGDDFSFTDRLDGVTLFNKQSEHTTTFENTYPIDAPRLMLVTNQAHGVEVLKNDNEFLNPDILFLAPVAGEINLNNWLKNINGGIKGAGLQGFLKKPGSLYLPSANEKVHIDKPAILAKRDIEDELHSLSKLDVIFLSVEDAAVHGDKFLIEKLKERVPVVVVTNGEMGAKVFVQGRGSDSFGVGVREMNPVDPTGAGDTFASVFLYSYAMGHSLEQAARQASYASSIVIMYKGADGIKKIDEAFHRFDEIPIKNIAQMDF